MADVRGSRERVYRFELEVTVTATVSIEAGHAVEARDRLLALLGGADAVVTRGLDVGMVLAALRPSREVVLRRVDGVDPFADLAAALRARHARGA